MPHRRLVTTVVFATALVGFFWYHGGSDDHYDRIARARQIAVYGDVPFRDFFDPGYFLTLYSSALLQRLLGDNLLGEALLNTTAMAAGTTLVFLLASRASGSLWWGLCAAALTLLSQPRTYDYDKVLFYPLGLWAVWHYVDRPTTRNLLGLAAVAVVGGLFRYDTAFFIVCAAFVALVSCHGGDWRLTSRRVAMLLLAALAFAAPALVFIQATSGLGDAFAQISTYAAREGARSSIFHAPHFDIDWSLPFVNRIDLWGTTTWFSGFARVENAAAWLYWTGVGVPAAVALILPLRRKNRDRGTLARTLSCAALGAVVALFILRDPVQARVGGVMPIITVGAGLLAGEWIAGLRAHQPRSAAGRARHRALLIAALVPVLLTCISVWVLLRLPPVKSLHFGQRLVALAEVPPHLDLLPKGARAPLASYLRACTMPADRVLVTWFAAELYFFSGRGFAAGMPVVFGGHWSELPYQRRALRLLETHRVPIILTEIEEPRTTLPFVWDFIAKCYDMVRQTTIGPSPEVKIWIRRGTPVTRPYGPLGLPCFAP